MKIKCEGLFWRILILVNILIIVLGVIFFQGNTKRDYSVNQKENAFYIGASYMTMNNEFYKIMNEEISAKVEAEGDRFILRDPALDADRQIRQIEEMMKRGIDVLIVTPVDWKRLMPILEQAKENGIIIIVLDTNVYNENLAYCTITSDNYNAGKVVGQYFVSQHEKAKVIVMTHKTAKSGQDRVQGFIDAVSGRKGIRIVQEIECEGQLEIAMPKLQEAIDKGIEFDHVFCLNDLAGVGVVAALEENDMLDKVKVYGVDASPDSKALIKEGMMEASAAQFPSEIGKKASEVIYQLLDGREVDRNILVPVELITKDNVEEFGIDRWQ